MRAVFVCVGNTCRTPMLEATLRKALSERGISADIESAGIAADGAPINPLAAETLKRHGVPFDAQYRSRRFDASLLKECDVVYAVTQELKRDLSATYGGGKILCISDVTGEEISDPFGSGQEAYEEAYAAIMRGLEQLCAALDEGISKSDKSRA